MFLHDLIFPHTDENRFLVKMFHPKKNKHETPVASPIKLPLVVIMNKFSGCFALPGWELVESLGKRGQLNGTAPFYCCSIFMVFVFYIAFFLVFFKIWIKTWADWGGGLVNPWLTDSRRVTRKWNCPLFTGTSVCSPGRSGWSSVGLLMCHREWEGPCPAWLEPEWSSGRGRLLDHPYWTCLVPSGLLLLRRDGVGWKGCWVVWVLGHLMAHTPVRPEREIRWDVHLQRALPGVPFGKQYCKFLIHRLPQYLQSPEFTRMFEIHGTWLPCSDAIMIF